MAINVRITPRAFDDLDEIVAYISLDAPEAALRWRDAMLTRMGALKHSPMRHGLAPEAETVARDVRQAIQGAYRILYEVRDREVVVLGVRHSARLPLQADELSSEK